MFNSCKEFRINETVGKISRFVDGEDYFTDIEERFHIPWRMKIMKNHGNFQFYLRCEKEECEDRKWSIEVEYTLKLVSQNGKSLVKNDHYKFEKPAGCGSTEFTSWKDLESDYVVDDSIVVEAHVKIIKVTDSPCNRDENQKIFLLNHTVKHISSIKEGGDYYTKMEKRYNIPWKLGIHRSKGFFGLFIYCDKKLSETRTWAIKVEDTLKLVSVNGQSLSFNGTPTFKEPTGFGFSKFIRWDDMVEKYVVNDSIIVEARVKIIEMTGFEEEMVIGDMDSRLPKFVDNRQSSSESRVQIDNNQN